MRLDEWQKFIESQYLDEGADSISAPHGGAGVAEEPSASQPHPSFELEAVPIVELAEEVPAPVLLFGGEVAEAETHPVLRSDNMLALSETPRPRIVADSNGPRSVEIPSFENYLPPSRTGRPAVTPVTVPEPARETPARRVPRTRARHARNVRPENVPSGLEAAELWTQAPKFVQTLLALERLGEETEVAQHSYKRPFEEKRRELIERLLDPILTLEETARLLNVCPTTVRRYTNKGILTYYRKEPERKEPEKSARSQTAPERETRQRRFRLSDVLGFLEAQQAAIEADQRADRARLEAADADTNDNNPNGQADTLNPEDHAEKL